ncbi:SRPBCC family protein [Chitinophaga agrisoli]|uniref:SRPBCC family protein n=1 Tax=Chitinophaga agrisoli TaxID=2607653 RepID=A0A5B2VVX8_9BACT|nr:SRPBCC family protein [Chitinophaga agrisoli]KAA2243255.1 SRPBCC family protein [Chitinophaga agrisoli]
MKILKRILIVIVILIAIPLIIALFSRKNYAVEREITINKPRQEVFDYIKYLKNQDNFSVWAKMDPGMKREYRGTDATVGFVSAWDSKKDVGAGEQEIKKITADGRIDYELRFIRPWAGRADSYLSTAPVSDNQTTVKWGMSSSMPYPMNIMLLVMDMDKVLGKDLQTGLTDLKTILEHP